jgi:glycosyltransferase involved in cell wall biosynthesis
MTTARRILMFPVADECGASSRYRVLSHLPGLRAAGFHPEVLFPLVRPGMPAAVRLVCRTAGLSRDLLASRGGDLLFIHRKTYPAPFARRLRRRPGPIVYDIDDAIDLPPPRLSATPALLQRYRSNFESTATAADLVLCGNAELARRLPHDRAAILPTPVDTERFAPGRIAPARGPAVGWVGHSDNLPYLESLAGPLREVARRHPNLKVIVVADRPPDLPGLHVEFRPWRLEEEVSCFAGIGVGLMPLADTDWARAKCAFKAIQYMALGIPTVASPVGMNRDVIRDGENGFLPADQRGWVETLDRLLADPPLTARLAAEGRLTIERDFSLRVLSARLVSLLEPLAPRV